MTYRYVQGGPDNDLKLRLAFSFFPLLTCQPSLRITMPFLSPAGSIVATVGVYALYALLNVLYREFTSPLRNVPGPKSDHWFIGNRRRLLQTVRYLRLSIPPWATFCFQFDGQEGLWTAQYGRTVRLNTWFGVRFFFPNNRLLKSRLVWPPLHYRHQGVAAHSGEQLRLSEIGLGTLPWGTAHWSRYGPSEFQVDI
jgi:hypothetical protein